LKAEKIFQTEMRFSETMATLGCDDPFIRQTASSTFIITLPHPTQDVEYVVSTWTSRKEAREFKDIGRAVNSAVKMGARSVHLDVRKGEGA